MNMETGKVIDSEPTKSQCVDEKHRKDKNWWTLGSGLGCHINGLSPGQKYEAVIHVLKSMDVGVGNIRIW